MAFTPRDFQAGSLAVGRKLTMDFRLTTLGVMSLLIPLAAGAALPLLVGHPYDGEALGVVTVGCLVAVVILLLLPLWILDIVFLGAAEAGLRWALGAAYWPSSVLVGAGFLLMPMVQLAQQWEKAVVFRLGRLRAIREPGVFLIAPIFDRVIRYVDTRIRVVEFHHETTLTRDTVPVSVDAIAFWMVWDAEKATLEVTDYLESVTLAAHAALRNAIGKHDLSDLLSEQESLGKEIQAFLDARTTAWGVTILSIGITDIVISKDLEDSLSKQAQAQRERQSRLLLAQAEKEVADAYVEASHGYRDNPTALQLRGMGIVYEGIRKNGTIVLLPSGAVQDMALGKALGDLARGKAEGGVE